MISCCLLLNSLFFAHHLVRVPCLPHHSLLRYSAQIHRGSDQKEEQYDKTLFTKADYKKQYLGIFLQPSQFFKILAQRQRHTNLTWYRTAIQLSPEISLFICDQSHQSFWSKKFFLADFPLWHQISPWHTSFQKRHFHPFYFHSLPFRYTVLLCWQVALWLIASYLSLYVISRLSIQFSISCAINVSMWLKIERPTFTPWLLSNLKTHLKMVTTKHLFK